MTTTGTRTVVCADIGSTFTKAALVDLAGGRLLARAEHPTTLGTDVLDGVDACRDRLAAADPAAAGAEVRACSSAGGGLRIGVVGNEELVTAEAGRRVALSSGGRVVHVAAGASGFDAAARQRLADRRPDVVLLVGGTDGGNRDVLLRSAEVLAGWPGPVVVAGNRDAAPDAAAALAAGATPYVLADNVVPRIGVLNPDGARAAIREVFLRHVIGGKHLSRRPEFAELVRGATPDLVLAAVELLGADRDVVVVDVGGATTDVYSVVTPTEDEYDAGLSREVVATTAATRTVEGDLGVRWSAPSTLAAAVTAGLVEAAEAGRLEPEVRRRRRDPSYVPAGDQPEPAGADLDRRLAGWAATVALQRHAGRPPAQRGADLREVGLVVLSGGVVRHADAGAVHTLLQEVSPAGGRLLPERVRPVVDGDYLLGAAGLLAADHPGTARALLSRLR